MFESFDSLNTFIKKYEEENKQKLWIRDSLKISTAKKRGIKRDINESLIYYSLSYACIHGGKKFKTRSEGIRNTKTYKMDCPFVIKLIADKDGKSLKIEKMTNKHEGHDLSVEVYHHLPQVRKLKEHEIQDISEDLELGSNPKLVKNKMKSKFNQDDTLKHLANIKSSFNKNLKHSLDEIANTLINIYKANVEIFRDDYNNFKGLYFQTKDMKKSMTSWPEIIFIDGTYKLSNNELTLFLMIVEDGNGITEIVGVYIVAIKDYATFKWMFQTFKKENIVACEKIQCFMGDKDLVERDVIKEIFPETPVYICLFHTLKTFKQTITTEKIQIECRNSCLELLNEIVYSSSDQNYMEIYTNFKQIAPKKIIQYYDKNWHPIKHEWTIYNMKEGNLLDRTNNKLEALNKDINIVIKKNSSITMFVNGLMNWLDCNIHKRDNRASQIILKTAVSKFKFGSTEFEYENLLTSYSFQYVLGQLKLSSFVNISNKNGVYTVGTRSDKTEVELYNCTCLDYSSIMLPCRHIFSLRKYLNINLYDEALCATRWHKTTYISQHRSVSKNLPIDTTPELSTSTSKNAFPSITEKRKIANMLCSSLVNIMCLSTDSRFKQKIQNLEDIINIWKGGKEITIQDFNIELINERVEENAINDNIIQMGIENNPQTEFEIKTICDNYNVPESNSLDNIDISNENNLFNNSNELDQNNLCVLDLAESNTTNLRCNDNVFDNSINNFDIVDGIDKEEVNILSNKSKKLPNKIMKKGRPKESDLAVMGLKKRRVENIPTIFKLKTDREKLGIILNLLVNDTDIVSQCLQSEYKINVTDIVCEIKQSFYDSEIDIKLIKNYVEADVFKLLSELKLHSDDIIWICNVCNENIGGIKSIICEYCLLWYHFKCVGIKSIPKIKNFICGFC